MKKYVYSEAKQVVVCGDFPGASVELCQGCYINTNLLQYTDACEKQSENQ